MIRSDPDPRPAVTARAGLVVEKVTKIYPGGKTANDGISLRIDLGEVLGLLGPNGAGKTTLVNQIIGLLRPTSGRISLGGVDLVRRQDVARRLCSHLPQGALPIDGLPAGTAVELMGRLRGGRPEAVRARARELFGALEIEEWRGQLGARLSGGVRRLVGFAMAAVVPGDLVILDEPTNDIDPLRRRLLWRSIRKLGAEGRAILLVTHNVLEAERSVNRLAVMDRGKILAQGTPASLKNADGRRLRLDVMLEPAAEPRAVPAFAEVRALAGRKMVLHLAEEDAGPALEWARGLGRDGIAESFELGPAALEDTYLSLVGRSDLAGLEEGNHGNAHTR
jgi:ABC-2 type transport system ATP-binding protein